MMSEAKTKQAMGASLFDMDGVPEVVLGSSSSHDDDDFPFIERLVKESDVVGLYLTGNPLDHVGPGLSRARGATISDLLKTRKDTSTVLVASLVDIDQKITRRGKSVMVTLDDGTGYLSARLAPSVVRGIDKLSASEKIRTMYEKGETTIPEGFAQLLTDASIVPLPPLQRSKPYVIHMTFRPGNDMSPYRARITSLRPLMLSSDGKLPVRIRLSRDNPRTSSLEQRIPRSLARQIPGEYPIYMAVYDQLPTIASSFAMDAEILRRMRDDARQGDHVNPRGSFQWESADHDTDKIPSQMSRTEMTETQIEHLNYVDTGLTTAKSSRVERALENLIGIDAFDFGIFDPTILEVD